MLATAALFVKLDSAKNLPVSKWFLVGILKGILNSPYACLRQTSKFHHQVSSSKYKVAKFYINEFPRQYG